jgi:hypothetical protein
LILKAKKVKEMGKKDNQSRSLSQSLWQKLQPGQWLTLEDLPSQFAENQALILCQVTPHHWITWVPNHGEYCLIL